jgi:hypothetical protein
MSVCDPLTIVPPTIYFLLYHQIVDIWLDSNVFGF